MNFQSFTKPFLATLGVVCGIAALPAVTIAGKASWDGLQPLLQAAEYKAYATCWNKVMSRSYEEAMADPLQTDISGTVKRDCGSHPSVYIWQK